MRMPLSWLAELTDLPAGARGADVAAGLVSVGLEEEDLPRLDALCPLGRIRAPPRRLPRPAESVVRIAG
jgi:hypothetical protein